MSALLGPQGQPMSKYIENKEHARTGRPSNPKPVMGDAFVNWSGVSNLLELPGGGAVAFDTSKLTMAHFRMMREHYQIGSSLHVLTFMLHQLDWHIECEDPKVQAWCEANLREVWTRLVRSMSSAFWAGYSANACEWENDLGGRSLRLNKVKDLVPEECEVNWKYVEGAPTGDNSIRPKIPVFDGIRQRGSMNKVPVTNAFWYPLLMENNDYGGRKLLRTAFQPWFFSSLIHLYQNKYFERFGEPVPIGRAPYNDKVKVGDKTMYGHDLMAGVISSIRSRSAVVLPNSRSREGLNDQPEYDYQVEYLESQMRGADFERYLTRLDEEMSLALFTPLLLLRTADSGGFNQGVAHTQIYLWMLNAIGGDWKEYIDKYILRNMAVYNFGPRAKLPQIRFRKLGTAQQETLRSIVQALISKDKVMPDVRELGEHLGISLEEIETLTDSDDSDPDDPDDDNVSDVGTDTGSGDKRTGRPERLRDTTPKAGSTTKAITQRIADQVQRVYKRGDSLTSYRPALGYHRQLVKEFEANGVRYPGVAAADYERAAVATITDAAGLGEDAWPDADAFVKYVEGVLTNETEKVYNGD